MKKPKILYVEDELNLGTIVTDSLEQKGFEVVLIKDGAKVMDTFNRFTPDLCVLDVMLPNIDGFELGRMINNRYPKLPIIFLTAKTQTQDVLTGFNSGATDYIRKPFSIEELVARIHNQLQLAGGANKSGETITIGKFVFHSNKYELQFENTIYKLSNREAEVLQVFCRNINNITDRKSLLLEVWGDDSFFHSRNLDVYIRKLREYFGIGNGVEIITLKGKGYQFVVNG
ncbi:MAG: response regulator transcription factor [Chitinophagales bacterium]